MIVKKMLEDAEENSQYTIKNSLQEFGIQVIRENGADKMLDPHSGARYYLNKFPEQSAKSVLFKSRIHFL